MLSLVLFVFLWSKGKLMEIDSALERVEIGWTWRDVVFVLILLFVGGAVLLIGGRTLIALGGFSDAEGLTAPVGYLLGCSVYLLVIGGVYLYAARRTGWAALGLRQASLLDYLLVLPLYIIGTVLLITINLLIFQLTGTTENPQVDAISGGNELTTTQLLFLFVLISGLAPFAEELFFRGMIYPLLRRRLPAAAAITINAALFAVVHFIPPLLPGLFIIGLFLAYLRERSGSIWPCVLYHFIQNSIALLAINAALSMGTQ
jgi:uncharacterized protein